MDMKKFQQEKKIVLNQLMQLNKNNQNGISLDQLEKWSGDQMDLPPFVDEIKDYKIIINKKPQEEEIQTLMILVNLHKDEKKKTIVLTCKENELIESIKEKIIIDYREKIQLAKIFIYFNNKICQNDKTLKQLKIQNNSFLEAWFDQEQKFNVKVKIIIQGSCLNLELGMEREIPLNIFVEGIFNQVFGSRDKINQHANIFFNELMLSHDDTRSLEEIGITNGCVLKLMVSDKHGCFQSDASVLMSDGSRKFISEISVGDTVLSYDYLEKKYITTKVIETHYGFNEFQTLIQTEQNQIICTPNTPFLTLEGWKAVYQNPKLNIQQFKKEDKIFTLNNQFQKIVSISIQEKLYLKSLYNITTEYPYNFFVDDILVAQFKEFIEVRLNNKIEQIEITSGMLIHNIKGMISMKQGIKIEQQAIFYNGLMLKDDEQINKYISEIKMLTLDVKEQNQLLELTNENPQILQLNLVSNKQAVKFNLECNASFMVLSQIIHQYLNIQGQEKSFLLCDGKIYDLNNFDNDIKNLKLQNQSTLIMLTENNLSSIQFSYFLWGINIQNITELKESLAFVEKKQVLNQFISNQIDYVTKDLKKKKLHQKFLLHHLIAIKIWTSSLVYQQVNIDLRNHKFDKWGKYLKLLLDALKHCGYYRGLTFRGIKNYQNTQIYSEGNIIQWSDISCSSKDIEIAKKFSNEQGMIFESELISSKDIEQLSVFEKEKEVLMLPFSQFTITSVTQQKNQPIYVKLRELPQPRWSQILLWIDDNPENNYQYALELEKENPLISVVFCISTKEAIDVIQRSRFMIYLDDSNVRIVTDMVRYEEGGWNYEAGITFLKYLIDNFNYDYQVLIFCGDEKKAKDNCKKLNIIGNYIISNQAGVLKKFIRFQ